MQKFQVIGNICNDLTLEETASGKKMLKFSVAVKREYTRGDGERITDFFDCLAWGGVAETISKWCKKGDKIYLEGRIETRSYEDNQGIKRKAIDFIVDKQEFLPNGKKEELQETDEHTEDWVKPRRKKPTMQPMDDIDGEVPF